MGKTWGTFIAKGIAIAVLYGIAYLALRYISFNQWFLPAGLRAACLLFMPYRYWPFLFLGDAGAVLYQRLPKLDDANAAWVFAGPFLLIASVALAPFSTRMKIRRPDAMHFWMPLICFLIATWAAICTTIFNYTLGGPQQPDDARKFFEYVTGNFLGILMFVLPVQLWRLRKWKNHKTGQFVRDTLLSIAAIAPLYLFVESQPEQQGPMQQVALMLMILPAAYMTMAHSWHGAAIGVLIVNLCIAQTMEYAGVPRYYDEIAYHAQIWLALISFFFFSLGSKLDEKQKILMTLERISSARMSLISNESFLRDQLICMAELQVLMDEERDELAKYLRANGKSREALDLNNRGMEHRHLFELQALVLYPIGIERYGLFGVLDTPVFRESRASGTEVDFLFGRIDPRTLSNDLQVLAYRCLCHAIDTLSDWEPTHYRLRLRVWNGSERRGIYICATIQTAYDRHSTPFGESASLLLDARVRANGGISHRTEHRISLLLLEPNDLPAASTTGFSTG